jgi:hypothetical protein
MSRSLLAGLCIALLVGTALLSQPGNDPGERAAGEDPPADAVAGFEADGGASGLNQLAHREHAGRPSADDDDICPIRQAPR